MNTAADYPQQVARALVAMRRMTVAQVAQATDINRQNVEVFLEGNNSALSEGSFESLFRFLGVVPTQEGPRLDSSRVHFLHLDCRSGGVKKGARPLHTIFPLIDSVSALELPRQRGTVPFLIRSERAIRIVLFVEAGRFQRVHLSDLGLAPGRFRGYDQTAQVPAYYTDLLFAEQIRGNYFDLILEGRFANESLDLLRLVALEHDVTLSDLVEALAANDLRASHERDFAVKSEQAYHREKVVTLFPEHFTGLAEQAVA